MTARLESVARYICSKSNWSISNLKLQKLMYLAQMIHMGRNNGKTLFDGVFYAWDYGTVIPQLYHKLKRFGAKPIQDVFTEALQFQENDSRIKTMNDVCNQFLRYNPGDLVGITHDDKGAWAKHYMPEERDVVIPNEDILDEYKRRIGVE